jgi:hypothetical protein
MLNLNIKLHLKVFALLSVALLSLTACSAQEKFDYELTGRVLDSVTKLPLEGVYVVAVYMGGGGTFAGHSSSWCRKTRGMYTKADGKFNFPVESRGGGSPMPPVAIKPGYGAINYEFKNDRFLLSDAKRYYTDQNLLLTPQDPEKPNLNFQSGETYCPRAASRQDAAAAVEFFKLKRTEYVKYGLDKVDKSTVDNVDSIISEMANLPYVANAKK